MILCFYQLPHAAHTALGESFCRSHPDPSFLSASRLVHNLVYSLVIKHPAIKSSSRYHPDPWHDRWQCETAAAATAGRRGGFSSSTRSGINKLFSHNLPTANGDVERGSLTENDEELLTSHVEKEGSSGVNYISVKWDLWSWDEGYVYNEWFGLDPVMWCRVVPAPVPERQQSSLLQQDSSLSFPYMGDGSTSLVGSSITPSEGSSSVTAADIILPTGGFSTRADGLTSSDYI